MKRFYFWLVIFAYFLSFFLSWFLLKSWLNIYDDFVEHILSKNFTTNLQQVDIKDDLKDIVFVWIDDRFFKYSGKSANNLNLQDYNLFLENIGKYKPDNILLNSLSIEFSKDSYTDYFFLIMKKKLLPTFLNLANNKYYELFIGYDESSLFLNKMLSKFHVQTWFWQLSKNAIWTINGMQISPGEQIPIWYKLFLKENNIKNYNYIISWWFYKIKSWNNDFFIREIPLIYGTKISVPIIASYKDIKYFSIYDLINDKNKDLIKYIKWKNIFLWINWKNFNENSSIEDMPASFYDINSYLSIKNNIFLKELNTDYVIFYITIIFIISIFVFIFTKDINYSIVATFIFIILSATFYNIFLSKIWLLVPLGKLLLVLFSKLFLEIFLSILWMYIWKNDIKWLFKQYVWEEILEQKELKKSAKSEYKSVFILFTDIEWFTSISEKLSPKQTIDLLNIYFTYLWEKIEESWGFIDKYIWDSIMAFWPWDHKADDILELLLELQSTHVQINEKIQETINPEITVKTRMWLHYGTVLVWDVWNQNWKISYTIIGDDVNLTSRLEWANKFYSTKIVFSDSFNNKIHNQTKYNYRLIDKIAVKWKDNFIKIYQLLPNDSKYSLEYIRKFETWIYHYLNWNFNNAFHTFCSLSDEQGSDKDQVCEIMKKRVSILKNDPDQKWEWFRKYDTK